MLYSHAGPVYVQNNVCVAERSIHLTAAGLFGTYSAAKYQTLLHASLYYICKYLSPTILAIANCTLAHSPCLFVYRFYKLRRFCYVSFNPSKAGCENANLHQDEAEQERCLPTVWTIEHSLRILFQLISREQKTLSHQIFSL